MATYKTEREFSLNSDGIRGMLSIYRDGRAWRSLAFLFLAFPLGIFYFVALVTGLSLGAGLAITLIGIPVLLAVFYAAGWVTQFEAWLSNRLLDADVHPTVYRYDDVEGGFFARTLAALRDVNRWKGLAYLMMRFPMGVMGFVVGTVLVSVPAAMITAPFTFWTGEVEIGFWAVNTLGEALLASLIGIFVGAAALHAAGWVTTLWRAIAEAMLTQTPTTKRKNNDFEKPKRDMLTA